MPDLSRNARAALWAWPHIEDTGPRIEHEDLGVLSSSAFPVAAARVTGKTTAQLWDAVKTAAPDEARFRSLGFGAGLSTLRGIYNRIVNAQGNLAAARPDYTLGAEYIADAPWGRSAAEQRALPQWQVRVPITGTTRAGVEIDRVITYMYQGSLPATVGELVDEATGAAVNRAFASDFTPSRTGVPQILAV